ncbi:MAG: M23 family metallopeptidase [Treponema sp.]|jgi:murein DD-endopeptidase MepM/ murein hydrolase activator NlpD|nr:M23 family metallopeptidase [Treponema sp.]
MKKIASAMVLILSLLCRLAAENTGTGFPVISRLDLRDIGFKQYSSDVELARQRVFNLERTGESPDVLAEALTIYAYTPLKTDTLLSLAARCNIPYSTLATLNRLAHLSSLETAGTLLLPSAPGIFIPGHPDSDLERLLAATRSTEAGSSITLTLQGGKETFWFIPGADFTPTERTFFLHTGFRYPLQSFRLTSTFGPRVNPVTGAFRVHQGLDLAAPAGTEVFAVRAGVVTEVGEDTIYGKYVIIRHGENWVSLYGHLSKIETVLRSAVESGSVIGRVGSTGQSTGPHLHFELRQNGKAQDPGKYLFKEGIR